MTAVRAAAPLCFMHVPKSGGTSIRHALEQTVPLEGFARMSLDRSAFCGGFEDFGQLSEEIRAQIALDEGEIESMAGVRIVAGHFSLATLSRLAPPSCVATVLREPRARLLSLYIFWRLHSLDMRERWHPYRAIDAAQRPLEDFLADPGLAPVTDNPVCRMLLYGDGVIPVDDLIPDGHAPRVAATALERLDTLGLVAVLETGQLMWERMSRFFGIALEPQRSNVTGVSVGLDAEPIRVAITPGVLELLDRRTAADAILYEHVLVREGWHTAAVRRLRDAAFAEQLVTLGDVSGVSAAEAADLRRRLAEREREVSDLHAELAERDAQTRVLSDEGERLRTDLARHQGWLDAIQSSASWRLTEPLRGAKRALSRSRR